MPKYKNNVEHYKIVSKSSRCGYDCYGAFDLDDEGYQAAEEYKRKVEDRNPHLDFEITSG